MRRSLSRWCSLFLLLIFASSVLAPGALVLCAFAQPNHEVEGVQYLYGQVVEGKNGKAVPDVRVHAFRGGQELASKYSDDDGRFVLGPLPLDNGNPNENYVVTADSKERALTGAVVVPQTWDKPLKLAMQPEETLQICAVTSAGAPVENVNVRVTGFRFPKPQGNGEFTDGATPVPFALPKTPSQTDAKGLATFDGLPAGVVELRTSCYGFSDGIYTVTLPHEGVASLKLPRETIFRGKVTLGGTRPVPVVGLQVKTQGWNYPWVNEWRVSEVAADGSYQLRNIPSPEQVGKPAYGINVQAVLNPGENKQVAPGITIAYVNGWNLMMTIEKDGKTERWISYVEAFDKAPAYKEGDLLQHDMVFQPLALLRGTLSPTELRRGQSIFYENPKSIYGPWSVNADANGNFELPVPVGEIKVNFPNGPRTFTNLKAHEVRVVEPQNADAP